ncbi:MAG: iron-containing alcohol dehydrogenase [Chloroflexi bacterium]|nr:iron-containing alcohol dehydrogenase [Chloroflexota bacterium]
MANYGEKPFEFRLPAVIHLGVGSHERVATEVARLGGQALVITDGSVSQDKTVRGLLDQLESAGLLKATFSDVPGEPTTTEVEGALARLQAVGAQSIVAIGGGSVIDTAKAVAVVATNGGSIVDYKGANKVKKLKMPLIVVNTTAGTGSEVTRNTIITDPITNVKMLIADPAIVPEVAIDDPLLTVGCPPSVTASAGLDALTHAIESYISVKSNALSDLLAFAAIKKIGSSIRTAYRDGNNLEARTAMLVASLEAGMSFSNSSVALVHGMARPIGAYFHRAHGISNAVLLPHVMAWSVSGAPERFATIAKALGVDTSWRSRMEAAQAAVETVRALCKDLGVPGLTGLGIDPDELMQLAPTMAKDALDSGSPGNNPRVPTAEEIIELYRLAL